MAKFRALKTCASVAIVFHEGDEIEISDKKMIEELKADKAILSLDDEKELPKESKQKKD